MKRYQSIFCLLTVTSIVGVAIPAFGDPAPIPPAPVCPSRLSFGSTKAKYKTDKAAYDAAVKAHADFKTEYDSAQTTADSYAKQIEDKIPGTGFKEKKEAYLTALKTLTSSDAVKAKVKEVDFENAAKIELNRVTNLKEARDTRGQEVLAMGGLLQEPGTNIEARSKELAEKIKGLNSPEEINRLADDFIAQAKKESQTFRAARQKAERRFNVNDPTQISAVATAAGEVFKDVLGGKLSSDLSGLATAMQKSPGLAKFVYREMQVARREQRLIKNTEASGKANDKIENSKEGLKARVTQDLALIRQAMDLGNATNLNRAMALRTQIRRINQPRIFEGLIVKNASVRTVLDIKHREMILSDALKSTDLAAVLINSASALPPMPEKPSFTVAKPVVPRSRTRSNVDRYKADVEAYKQAANKYNTETVVQWKDKMTKYKTLEARRQNSRRAVLAYLAERYSELKIEGKTDILKVLNKRAKTVSNAKLPKDSKYQGRTVVDVVRTNNTLGDGMYLWLMFAYTNNPMWLISPEFALMQLMFSAPGIEPVAGYDDIQAGYPDVIQAAPDYQPDQIYDTPPKEDVDSLVQSYKDNSTVDPDTNAVVEPDGNSTGETPVVIDPNSPDATVDNTEVQVEEQQAPDSVDPILEGNTDVESPTVEADIPSVESVVESAPEIEVAPIETPSYESPATDYGGGGGADYGGGGGGGGSDFGGGGGGDGS